MNKTILTVSLSLFTAFAMNAQLLDVVSMEKVKLPQGVEAEQMLLSPDAKTMAFTDFHGTLSVLDRTTQKVSPISKEGSMMDLAFTADGSNIVYREHSYDKNSRRLVAVKSYDIAKASNRVISAPSHRLEAVDVRGVSALTVDNGRAKVVRAAVTPAAVEKQWPVTSIERGLLYITENGQRRLVSPLGTDGMSYMWASISPDGNRLLFFAAGYGTYTCTLEGKDMHRLGYIYAPVWYDNNTVVGMKTKDDGRVTYEGRIVASNAEGTVFQTLTDDSLIAVLPSAAPGRIAFTTTDGKAYILNIKK